MESSNKQAHFFRAGGKSGGFCKEISLFRNRFTSEIFTNGTSGDSDVFLDL